MIDVRSQVESSLSEDQLNFIMAFNGGMEPRNEAEAMLALQMATVNSATVVASRHLANAQQLNQYDSAVKAVTKPVRTYTTQMETLKRFHGGGEQIVTVKHVHVHEGSQAIVGNVSPGAGVGKK